MTTPKTPSAANKLSNQSQNSQEGTTQLEGTAMGLAPSQEQMTDFIYGLLSQEESILLEQRVSESDSYREALEASRETKALFACWEDVPAPEGLADRALAMIQASSDQ